MKAKIHPKYHKETKVTCNCGESFVVGSTLPEIKVEVCSACHPFYTGKSNLIDTAGRVDKFKAREQKAKELAEEAPGKKQKVSKKQPQTNKDKLKELKKSVSSS